MVAVVVKSLPFLDHSQCTIHRGTLHLIAGLSTVAFGVAFLDFYLEVEE